MKYMAIIENIINVLVPLLICGLIFIYFRRRITNLEQSVDIIMKMLQTNQLNNRDSQNSDNHLVNMDEDDVYVPSSDTEKIKTVEMNNLNLEETNDSESESDDSESEESESDESESESDDESGSDSEEKQNTLTEVNKLDESNTTNIEELVSLVTPEDDGEETNNDENKKIVLSESASKEELESKTLNELKKMLKEKVQDINNLSRMNKATVIENLIK